MCGIYGIVAWDGAPPDLAVLDRMAAALVHRGPDGHGRVVSGPAALGARRLRIIDRSPQSDQPFTDPSGHVVLVCNGEIYNAPQLRRRFADYPYRSRSDLEPIVPLYLAHGASGIEALDGMFALALWDGRTRSLVLARDRAGEKPLFLAARHGRVALASEIQALLALPGCCREIDPDAARDIVALGYILEPRTPFRGVRRLAAGTVEIWRNGDVEVRRYWRPHTVAERRQSVQAALEDLDRRLSAAVRAQTRAEVPVGVFLSGGVDSALLTAIAARVARQPLLTFSVGFDVPSYDEAARAAAVARALGAPHVTVRADVQALAVALDAITNCVAEPLADPAALPTWLLARAAARRVGVVLSGEGADELFGGYPTYLGHELAPLWTSLPAAVRRALRALAHRYPASFAKVPLEYLLKRFVDHADAPWLERHVAWAGAGGPQDSDRAVITTALAPEVRGVRSEVLHRAMLLDYRTYLRDHLLVKIDRTTMQHSLEARAPYLDRSVTEFALGLPVSLRVRGLTTKRLLKRLAARYLPRAVVRRRKRGLSVPIAQWMNGDLRSEVDRLLAAERVERWGVLDPREVQRRLAAHRAGAENHARALWPVIVWERWVERWG